MKQKFRKLTFVKVSDEMPFQMQHFPKGFIAIVDGTYSQIYGGDKTSQYSLYIVEGDKVKGRLSWYYEDQLTALENQDREKAEQMIEDYNFSS